MLTLILLVEFLKWRVEWREASIDIISTCLSQTLTTSASQYCLQLICYDLDIAYTLITKIQLHTVIFTNEPHCPVRAARLTASWGRGGSDLQHLLHGQHEDSQHTDSVRLLLILLWVFY